MTVVDLNALFQAYLSEQFDTEQLCVLEDELQDIYLTWLGTPCEALNGVRPGQLFSGDDSSELIESFISYCTAGLNPPDPLLDEIADRPDCEEGLISIAVGENTGNENARKFALELLTQMCALRAADGCIKIVENREQEDELADQAYELLANLGSSVKERLIDTLDNASEFGTESLLSLLADMPHDDRIFYVLVKYLKNGKQIGFISALLQRYGDERALPFLEETLQKARPSSYYDFLSLRDAIHTFGGKVTEEPDYSGDPDYDRIHKKQDAF